MSTEAQKIQRGDSSEAIDVVLIPISPLYALWSVRADELNVLWTVSESCLKIGEITQQYEKVVNLQVVRLKEDLFERTQRIKNKNRIETITHKNPCCHHLIKYEAWLTCWRAATACLYCACPRPTPRRFFSRLVSIWNLLMSHSSAMHTSVSTGTCTTTQRLTGS